MSDIVKKIVFQAIEAQELLLGEKFDKSLGDDAPLFGGGSIFDSMALVSLIAHIEELIEAELEVSVILVSEKAMSARRSPFATVGTLTSFINESIEGGQCAK